MVLCDELFGIFSWHQSLFENHEFISSERFLLSNILWLNNCICIKFMRTLQRLWCPYFLYLKILKNHHRKNIEMCHWRRWYKVSLIDLIKWSNRSCVDEILCEKYVLFNNWKKVQSRLVIKSAIMNTKVSRSVQDSNGSPEEETEFDHWT